MLIASRASFLFIFIFIFLFRFLVPCLGWCLSHSSLLFSCRSPGRLKAPPLRSALLLPRVQLRQTIRTSSNDRKKAFNHRAHNRATVVTNTHNGDSHSAVCSALAVMQTATSTASQFAAQCCTSDALANPVLERSPARMARACCRSYAAPDRISAISVRPCMESPPGCLRLVNMVVCIFRPLHRLLPGILRTPVRSACGPV